MVKQPGSTSNSSESSEEEKENPKAINILKKPIKALKQMEEFKKTQEALESQATHEPKWQSRLERRGRNLMLKESSKLQERWLDWNWKWNGPRLRVDKLRKFLSCCP